MGACHQKTNLLDQNEITSIIDKCISEFKIYYVYPDKVDKIENYLKALKIAEELNDKKSINSIFENIQSVLDIGVVSNFLNIPSFLYFVLRSILPYIHEFIMVSPMIPGIKKSIYSNSSDRKGNPIGYGCAGSV